MQTTVYYMHVMKTGLLVKLAQAKIRFYLQQINTKELYIYLSKICN
jgi:hypothetical protein